MSVSFQSKKDLNNQHTDLEAREESKDSGDRVFNRAKEEEIERFFRLYCNYMERCPGQELHPLFVENIDKKDHDKIQKIIQSLKEWIEKIEKKDAKEITDKHRGALGIYKTLLNGLENPNFQDEFQIVVAYDQEGQIHGLAKYEVFSPKQTTLKLIATAPCNLEKDRTFLDVGRSLIAGIIRKNGGGNIQCSPESGSEGFYLKSCFQEVGNLMVLRSPWIFLNKYGGRAFPIEFLETRA